MVIGPMGGEFAGLADVVMQAMSQAGFGVFVVADDDHGVEVVRCNRHLRRLLDGVAADGEPTELSAHGREQLVRLVADWRRDGTSAQQIGVALTTIDEVATVDLSWACEQRDGREYTTAIVRNLRREADGANGAIPESFRALVESASDAVVVSRRGEVLFANAAAATLLELDCVDELIGRSLGEFVDPSEVPMMRERMQRVVRGERLAPMEYSGIGKKGRAFFAEVSSLVVPWHGGNAIAAVVRDISERKKLHAELMQADRLASVGLLASGVAHEINNPLTYVLLHLAKLRRVVPEMVPSADDLDEVERLLAQAVEGGDRVTAIVRDLLTFVRADHGPRTLVDVGAVVDSACKLAVTAIDPSAQVMRRHTAVPLVRGDRARLGQVFINVIVNALQAMLESSLQSRELTTTVRVAGQDVVVEIQDRGPGIDAAISQRLFDPFFTTKGAGHGTGLGLSLSRSIVVDHGGTITAASRDGGGTTVVVVLPICTEPVDESPGRGRARTLRARVLVVDDDERVLDAFRDLLSVRYSVDATASGAGALRRLLDGESFDVILCDLAMPGTDAVDVFARMSVARPRVADRMLFITGGARTDRQREFAAAHADRLLTKPIDPDELFDRVDAVVESLGLTATIAGEL